MSFASLPFELRSLIWSLAVAPRRITITKKKSNRSFSKEQYQQGKNILYQTSSTPPPALMHVCRESRQQAPYTRAFTAGSEPRWTWINFEVDILCVTSLYAIPDLLSHRSEIQRLQIRTDDDLDWYESATNYNGLSILSELERLREIRVVLEPGDLMWGDVFTDWGFGHCPEDNITFLDKGSGLVLTGPQLKMVLDWRMVFAFGSEGNPPDPDSLSDEIAFALDDSWHMTLTQMQELD
ncbi:hypothetical protein TGAM01_v202005 [Trichoderma gamsii]|uniref:2EXR domain-containing protein n=1 Tax=Trichoderma gamsii TaxID=398673 RepID=A0A2P4ZX70_9HYPO|nr:hypothetical protein TGAM01_v202005 [Trichoderma gamsii]PON28897.1 hypothetical protein TGAM01_v202005 [Trichoderma gamsii]